MKENLMPNILITGANRGIGLEFARHYTSEGWDVIATARDPGEAGDLSATGARVLALDLADPASVDAFVAEIGDTPIDVLLSNAGVMGPLAPDRDGWIETLAVNAVAPTLLALRLKPNLKAGTLKKAIATTSRMGSIADNDSGGFYAYRSSKAALNAAWKSLSIEFRADDIAVAVVHPGWVRTDMGGPNAMIDTKTSIAGLAKIVDDLDLATTGRFWDYSGDEIAW